MNIDWEYALPTDEKSEDYQYEGPIYINRKKLYYIAHSGCELQLHIIDTESGIGKIEYIPEENGKISCHYFFVEHSNRLFIYTGSLFVYDGEAISKWIDLKNVCLGGSACMKRHNAKNHGNASGMKEYKDLAVHLVYGNKLFFKRNAL